MKKVALYFFSLVLIANIFFMSPVRANAFSVVGSNALKSTVIGTMERAGVKFESREAKERAWDAWNMKAYEKWRIDEATGRNKDLWEAFETIKTSGVTPTPLDEVPGFGKVLVNATWFGMAAWIGAEVGLDIQQNALDKTRMQYWADGYRTYEGISYNPSFGIHFGPYYQESGWWKKDVLWNLGSGKLSSLPSPYKDDPALYYHITKVEDYTSEDVKIYYEHQHRTWPGELFINKNNFLWDKTEIPPLEKYDFVPKPTDVPTRNIPEPLTKVIEVPDVGKIPGVMPSAKPVPIIVPLGDPFADNPHNPPYDIPGKNPEPGKDPDPEKEPDEKEPNDKEPDKDKEKEDLQNESKNFGELVTTRFPFSLPWDFMALLKLLYAEPMTPRWEIKGTENIPLDFTIDLEFLNPYISWFRGFVLIGFIMSVIFMHGRFMGGSK